ncbi:ABC transporter substrate-binding protein [Frigidibacter albus]|uniref:ABC transporter substrate-binding protein n=1 Tax=Frigidibacter albus TaxID=1465486 RepID=A0A6L8VD78_9RHOB|nr:ABC transporter substrate-binding protein [Frigidibacter albus]MZQ87626.1 ABC transporter substrate-binding protein [Frigidibacter albus]NBE29532.1 ABC transporter substrate-binding protein [Frigidibacter albus]GGH44278.1 ABC transporter ATP-binding protein [Frigidibacter albus]
MKHPIAALLATLALAVPAHAQDKLTLILDWYVNPDHAPIILAQELGFFADQGLEVEVIAPADPSEPPKLVAAGRADLAVSYQPQLHLQVHEGLPLVRVGTLVATPLNCLMVTAGGPVQTLADLKGRKVGYSVSGVEEAVMAAMLRSVDLGLGDVEMINVNWSLTPALMTGQVDAVIGAFRNFELTQMRLAGTEGRCFFPEEAGLPSYDELIFVANSETLDRALVGRFMAAIEKGTEYMINHPDAAFAAFSATSPDLAGELNTQAWADTMPRFAHSPAALDHGRYARFEAFLHEAGLIDSILPVSQLAVDPGAVE